MKCYAAISNLPDEGFATAAVSLGSARFRLRIGKPRDYEQEGELEAQNEYDAWERTKKSDRPLELGDILEAENGQLRICKYVGFEPAQWVLPEQKQQTETEPAPPPAQ